MLKLLMPAAVAMTVAVPAAGHAAAFLSEQGARAKAVAILLGDPYGKTAAEVRAHIKGAEFERKRPKSKPCGPMSKPTWAVHVFVPSRDLPDDQNGGDAIDGFLVIDARTGKLECATLPFLS